MSKMSKMSEVHESVSTVAVKKGFVSIVGVQVR